jgi:uncharacterized protein (TIGR03382 family)
LFFSSGVRLSVADGCEATGDGAGAVMAVGLLQAVVAVVVAGSTGFCFDQGGTFCPGPTKTTCQS